MAEQFVALANEYVALVDFHGGIEFFPSPNVVAFSSFHYKIAPIKKQNIIL